ncbi:MAG: hypothetical protein V9G09_11685 [Candidatus Nanopelagicales bacterium]
MTQRIIGAGLVGALVASVGGLSAAASPAQAEVTDCVITGSLKRVSVTAMGMGGFYDSCPSTDTRLPQLTLPQYGDDVDFFEWTLAGEGAGHRLQCVSGMTLNGTPVLASDVQAIDVQQWYAPGQMIVANWTSWPLDQKPDPAALREALDTPTRSGTASFSVDCGADGSSSWTRGLSIVPAPPPGRDPGLSIENGAEFTNSTKVKLYLGWEGGRTFDKVKVSNDGGFARSRSEEFDLTGPEPIPWKLVSLGNERLPKTVYVKFRVGSYPQYWVDKIYTDDIILDTVKPEIVSASLGSAGPAVLAAKGRTLRVKARDNKSGIRSMQVSKGKPRKKAKVLKYRKTVSVARSGRLFVRVRDGAGNWSKWKGVA